MAATYYICKKSGIIHLFSTFFNKPPDRIFGIFLKTIKVFPAFFEKSLFFLIPATRCLYRGYCQGGVCFGPCFQKNFQKISEITRPDRRDTGPGVLKPPREAVTPFIQFFWKTLSKKMHFSEKKRKKVPDREFPVTNASTPYIQNFSENAQ